MSFYHQIIVICWLLFLMIWAILALVFGGSSKRSCSPITVGMRLMFLVAIIIGLRYSGRIPVQLHGAAMTGLAAAGAVLCTVGLIFAAWARVVLGRNWGMPMTRHEDPELVTSGPYRYVRHPIYSGLIAMWTGTVLVYPLITPIGAVIIVYSLISVVSEERDMEEQFPEAYPEYRNHSKLLLPFLI